jgi:ribosomal protein S27AE
MHIPVPSARIPCPRCAELTGMFLAATSDLSTADHYCCDRCGHAWTSKKHGPAAAGAPEERDRSDTFRFQF